MHSPLNWIESKLCDYTKESFDGGDSSSIRGQLYKLKVDLLYFYVE